ncbi:MAG: type II toxin-antitoxin system VapC family toxin [Gemmatimonadota bacterium]
MIVADTGAIVALIDADDRHHGPLLQLFDQDPDAWILPWAILPEVDYLLLTHVAPYVELAFVHDLADGRYAVEWGDESDLSRARELCDQFSDLHLGLTDAIVLAVAERLAAGAIATLDLRHFGAVKLRGEPKLLPRDL